MAHFSLFRKVVGQISWDTALKCNVAHESWQVSQDSILTVHEQSIPMFRKTSRSSGRLARLSRELMAELQYKRAAYRRSNQEQATKQKFRTSF